MFVSEIVKEAEYEVQVSGTGRSKSFDVVNVDTGNTVSRHRNMAMANAAKRKLMPKPLSPVDKLKKKANTDTTTDRRVGKDAAKDYLDKKGLDPDTGDPKADKLKTPKTGFMARTREKLAAVGKKIGGRGAGFILFMFVAADQFFKDLQVFAKVYEKEGCVKGTPNVNTAHVRFADRLTSNIASACLAIAATGV